ncbi:hypothetical protein BSKO_14121 [Bryopsis sp. KO-2023]|nr:hypothetical protein BSKO_14121 [Bryopsis sp. KO-2023]
MVKREIAVALLLAALIAAALGDVPDEAGFAPAGVYGRPLLVDEPGIAVNHRRSLLQWWWNFVPRGVGRRFFNNRYNDFDDFFDFDDDLDDFFDFFDK